MPKRWDILVNEIRSHDYRRVAEIGTRAGKCMDRVLSQCPDVTWFAVDHWPVGFEALSADRQAEHERDFDRKAEYYHPRVIKHRRPSTEAAPLFVDGYFDLVFIDADHSYKGVRGDILAWQPKVRKGGTLCGHDYNFDRFPGVCAAVNELLPNSTVKADHVWLNKM